MKLEDLRDRYVGDRAKRYDRDRLNTPEWIREQEVVVQFSKQMRLKPTDLVLDIPVGTGRFLDLYAQIGCRVIGIDISEDMLKQAISRASGLNLNAKFSLGDITNIDLTRSSARAVICVRILNLLDIASFRKAIAEVSRVSAEYIIAGVQVRINHHSRWRLDRRLVRALRTALSANDDRTTTPHPKELVYKEFRREGLAISQEALIVQSNSSPYYLYLLTKSESNKLDS